MDLSQEAIHAKGFDLLHFDYAQPQELEDKITDYGK